eukprot:FR742517.1.p1 GENE.FR742517.1~~FR742517.1.p1  ORF type:complete len:253 (+),score=6.32 FR742517.1:182-940(+)
MATATVFKFYLFHMSWRRVLIVASIISICFSLNDVVGVAFFGDSSSSCSVYLSFDICAKATGALVTPLVIDVVYVSLCRGKGGKGNLYLLLDSFTSVASGWAGVFSAWLYEYGNAWFGWGSVSVSAIEDHHDRGYLWLTLTTALIPALALLALPFIPDSRSDIALSDGEKLEVASETAPASSLDQESIGLLDSVPTASSKTSASSSRSTGNAVMSALTVFWVVSPYGPFPFGWVQRLVTMSPFRTEGFLNPP